MGEDKKDTYQYSREIPLDEVQSLVMKDIKDKYGLNERQFYMTKYEHPTYRSFTITYKVDDTERVIDGVIKIKSDAEWTVEYQDRAVKEKKKDLKRFKRKEIWFWTMIWGAVLVVVVSMSAWLYLWNGWKGLLLLPFIGFLVFSGIIESGSNNNRK